MTWIHSSRFAKKVRNAGGVERIAAEVPENFCPTCSRPIDNDSAPQDWTLLPSGVKFDPNDREILDHLAAKVGRRGKPHALIDEFIPTLEDDEGICCRHPEKLPGVKNDGSSSHFFHRPSNAYTKGTRKRRKVQTDDDDEMRWHKTGKTRPVMENGELYGWKKIMVLYTNFKKKSKPKKTNWVIHQYHLGNHEDEREGELVMSKVFYQTQPRGAARDACEANEATEVTEANEGNEAAEASNEMAAEVDSNDVAEPAAEKKDAAPVMSCGYNSAVREEYHNPPAVMRCDYNSAAMRDDDCNPDCHPDYSSLAAVPEREDYSSRIRDGYNPAMAIGIGCYNPSRPDDGGAAASAPEVVRPTKPLPTRAAAAPFDLASSLHGENFFGASTSTMALARCPSASQQQQQHLSGQAMADRELEGLICDESLVSVAQTFENYTSQEIQAFAEGAGISCEQDLPAEPQSSQLNWGDMDFGLGSHSIGALGEINSQEFLEMWVKSDSQELQ